jgi:hypothetical protein
MKIEERLAKKMAGGKVSIENRDRLLQLPANAQPTISDEKWRIRSRRRQ